MWHLHWSAEAPRRKRPAESARATDVAGAESRTDLRADIRADVRAGRRRATASHGSFQSVRRNTPDAAKAADVPESVRVRGR